MTENNPDEQAGQISPWSAQAATGAAQPSGDRTPSGEQGPTRAEAGTPARGEQGPTALGTGTSDQTAGGTEPPAAEHHWGRPQATPHQLAEPGSAQEETGIPAQGEQGPAAPGAGTSGQTSSEVAGAPVAGQWAAHQAAEQGSARVEAGTPARGEQGPTAPGTGTAEQVPSSAQQQWETGAAQWPADQRGGWQPAGARSEWSAPQQPGAQSGSWQAQPQAGATQQAEWPAGAAQQQYNWPPSGPHQGTQQYPQPRREPRRIGFVVGVAVLALVVGGGAGVAGGLIASDARSPVQNALEAAPPAKQTAAPAGSVESVAQKVLPTVVQLQVRGRSSAGEGSGFVISSDGYIVTNNHVIEGAAAGGQIQAVFQDGRTATATIVGRDPTSDVAVVKAQGVDNLQVSELGRSDDLRVGQAVVAIGSPFELSGTVTSGIVSSLHRPTRAGGEGGSQATVMDAIQTDAAINPGNSGGPLVNMQGQVIGINSAIYSPQSSASGSGGSVGIGFAIPIDQARRTADEIVKTGKATQTVLGVSVRDADDGGALIAEVVSGGAGEQAGLKPGDVVTKLNDRRIDTADALVAAVRSQAPGDKVTLTLAGDKTSQATLGGQPVETG
ncbi:putative serine protease PepD [Actinokineospora globicatena]|nr:putative serine protease PepD [Actinokineospora globicatena]GLW81229.1 hypothetical protein Aglo01_57100 [Actinokineospora globicatena]GLW89163.1 hypothetical protein Aglo02_68020 [Actinokineospora globicatena]